VLLISEDVLTVFHLFSYVANSGAETILEIPGLQEDLSGFIMETITLCNQGASSLPWNAGFILDLCLCYENYIFAVVGFGHYVVVVENYICCCCFIWIFVSMVL
jgi:hypothetical protein